MGSSVLSGVSLVDIVIETATSLLADLFRNFVIQPCNLGIEGVSCPQPVSFPALILVIFLSGPVGHAPIKFSGPNKKTAGPTKLLSKEEER